MPCAALGKGAKLQANMFLKPASEVPHEFGRVCALMRERPGQWLRDPAAAAACHRASMLGEVGLSARASASGAPVSLGWGMLTATDRVAWLPIRLEFRDAESLLRSFFGSVDAAWLGDRRTYLAMSVQYDLPLNLGHIADRALLHRVAEMVARRFLNDAMNYMSVCLDPPWAGG